MMGAASLFMVKQGLAHSIIQHLIIRKKDKEYVDKLQKLDELYKKGQISREAYERLRQEIEEKSKRPKAPKEQ